MRYLVAFGVFTPQFMQFLRYVAIGCLNVVFGLLIYWLGIRLHGNYVLASVVSWMVSLVASYFLHSGFVFQKSLAKLRMARFSAVNLLSLGINLTILTVLVKGVGVDPFTAAIVAIPAVMMLNFLAFKLFVFR